MTFQDVMTQVAKFDTYLIAKCYADRSQKAKLIIMGDDKRYWVTTLRYAYWLLEHGYEIIN